MSALINPPYPLFFDKSGNPLENGYIWIGTANLNPQTNHIAVYWDAALTIAAAQPIRTLNGYPSRAGTPARFYTDTDYSIQVLNKKGVVVYTSLNENAASGGGIVLDATGDGIQTAFTVSSIPSFIFINGVYQLRNTYTTSANTVTFSEAPPYNSKIEFLF